MCGHIFRMAFFSEFPRHPDFFEYHFCSNFHAPSHFQVALNGIPQDHNKSYQNHILSHCEDSFDCEVDGDGDDGPMDKIVMNTDNSKIMQHINMMTNSIIVT